MRTIIFTVALALLALPAMGQTKTDSANSETTQNVDRKTEETVTKSDSSSTENSAVKPKEKKQFELTFDNLKFEMEKGGKFERSMLTSKIVSYHNNTVSLRGYIRPSFSQTGLTKFIFVRDNKECCFGPGAAIFDCVLVRMAKGEKTDFTVRPVTVEGTFSLKEYNGPDGKVWAVYRMNNASMK